MPSQIGAFVLTGFYAVVRFATIVIAFLWRWTIAALVTGRAFLQAVWVKRILTSMLILGFGAGIPMQLYQEEIMTWFDQVYECGAYPGVQFIANAFPLPLIRIPWDETIAPDYNEIGLFIFESASDVYGDIRTLARIGKITGMKDGLSALFGAIGGRPGGGWPFGGSPGDGPESWADIFDLALEALAGYIVGWYEVVLEAVWWLARMFVSWVIRLDAFNLSCSLCSLDPTASCQLREPWFPDTPAYDCDDCHELQADFVGIIGGVIDATTGSFVAALSGGTSFKRIGRALGCVLRSIWMAPIQIIDASIELAIEPCYTELEIFDITDYDSMIFKWFFAGDPAYYDCDGSDSQTCCGKPSGCEFPQRGGRDLPIGFLPCIGELFLALTDDEIDDWLNFLLSFVFEFIGDVIFTVERSTECGDPPGVITVFENTASISGNDVVINGSIVVFSGCNDKYTDCDEDPAGTVTVEVGITLSQCFDNFQTQTGSHPIDLGTCGYDDTDIVPDGGIYECFNLINECLAFEVEERAPLLKPLVDAGILNFLLNDMWRYTIDFVVCPLVDIAGCFDGTSFETLTASFVNLDACNPALGSWLGWVGDFLTWVDMFVLQAINAVESALDDIRAQLVVIFNVFECLHDCSGVENILGEVAFLECFPGGDGDCEDEPLTSFTQFMTNKHRGKQRRRVAMDDNAQLERWRKSLVGWSISPSTFCGEVLYSTTPSMAAQSGDWGNYATFMSCHSMYRIRHSVETACNVTHSTNSGLLTTIRDTYNTISACDPEGIALITDHRPRNSTDPILPRKSTSIREFPLFNSTLTMPINNITMSSTWWSHIADLARNITKMENLGAMGRVIDQIRTTRVYARSVEFYSAYIEVRGTTITSTPATKWHLDEMYTEYANDVISLYNRGVFRNETLVNQDELLSEQYMSKTTGKMTAYLTPASMSSAKERAIAKMQSLHLIESHNFTNQQKTNAHARIDAETWKTWTVINDALHIEYNEGYQAAGGILRALYTRDGMALLSVLSGSHKYVTSRNEFVPAARFRKESRVAGGQKRPTLFGIITGRSEWQNRKPRKYFPFFPIPAETPQERQNQGSTIRQTGSWRENMYKHMKGVHKKYESRRSDTSTHDANQFVYDALDWIFGLFSIGGETGLFNGLVQNTVDFWDEFDLRDFTEESVVNQLEAWATCSIPENIDGTSLHSPVCLGLLREDSFALLSGVTHDEGQFPEQIPWPSQFITKDCTTHYNGLGADNIIEFEWSNNCLLPLPSSGHDDDCNTSTCAGNLTITTREVSVTRDVVEYVVLQKSGDCSVEGVSLQTPPCTSVVAVVSDEGCVTSYDASGNATCFPIPNIDSLHVKLNFNTGSDCTFRVHYADAVKFTGSTTELFVEAANGGECASCSLRYPALTCQDASDSLVDLNRDDRPHCSLPELVQCDYCEREYAGCHANDFADVLDEFLYITGVFPFVTDELLFGGIDAKTFELWYGPPVVMAAIFLNIVLITNISLFCGVCFFPITALTINAAHLLTWSLFIFLGAVLPYPLVFFGVTVYAQTRAPKWWEMLIWLFVLSVSEGIPIAARVVLITVVLAGRVPSLKNFLMPIFVLIYTVFAIWMLSLVFTFPKLSDSVNINQGLADIFFFIDNSMMIWFVDWGPLRSRIDMYIYPSYEAIPEWHHFCAWWNWGNIALLFMVFLFGIYPIMLLLRWIWAPILGLLASIWAIMDVRRRILFIFVRQKATDASEVAGRNKKRILALRKRASRAINKAREDFVRKLVGERGVPPMPSSDQLAQRRGDDMPQFDWDDDDNASDDNNHSHADSGPDGLSIDTSVVVDQQPVTPLLGVQRRRRPTRLTLEGVDTTRLFEHE